MKNNKLQENISEKFYRNTYMKVNLRNIEDNVKMIKNRYDNYKYYLGVVKADSYGMYDKQTVKAIINGGVNYLAVSSLDEALEIREFEKDIPILVLGIIPYEYMSICEKNRITVTVPSLEYLKEIINSSVTVHIKIDTGMNRIGIKDKKELNDVYKNIKESNLELEGIFTHIYNANDKGSSQKQYEIFEDLLKDINLKEVPIVHIQASEALENYKRKEYINGCRLGIIMYGFSDKMNLKSTMELHSQIIQIKQLQKGETVGYNGIYKAKTSEKIGIVAIGYADGIIRKNTGRYVYINNRRYQIVGNVCMDMLMVKIDENVNLYDDVLILKDNEHIKEVSKYLETIPYEVICNIGKRVPRIYE